MKTKKRMLSIILAAVMIISMLPIATHAVEPVFSDMPDNWSTAALKHAVENGLLQGSDGKLMPDDNLTRAQMATIIVRAFGATKKGNISHYTDIKATDWYADNMAIAYQMGIIQGSDNKMNPGNPITRQEAFVIIARALKLEPEHTFNKVFTDAHEIADWAEGEIKALVNNGYIQGSNGKLNPKGHITRAEFAQVLHNIIKQYINKEGEYSTVSDGNIMINTPGVTLKNATIKGDLIIGEGVGDGEVVLEDVEITGRMVVRGGGKDSIIIKGSSKISKVIVARTYGTASIKIQDKADISKIIIDESSKDVNIEGQTKKIEVKAPNIIVEAIKAEIDTIEIYGQGSVVILDKDTRVKTIAIKEGANKAEVDVEGKADTIITTAASTKITGSGEVSKVEVKEGADKSKIETPNTEITVDKGVTGVTGRGGTAISGGTTAVNVEKDIAVETPKEEDKGGGGGGGSSKSSVSAISVTPKELTLTVGETGQITATVSPSNATNKKVNWSSSDEGVATVDGNGKVTAVGYGIATITVTSAADNTKAATCKVIVANDWSDLADTSWYDDSETSFTISTAAELAGLAKLVNNGNNFSGKTINLGADIDLLNLEWIPIGTKENTFRGKFDGADMEISNLKIDKPEENYKGLFGVIGTGTVIKDMSMKDVNITGYGWLGAVAGWHENSSTLTIDNVDVTDITLNGHRMIGGVLGQSYNGAQAEIKDCDLTNVTINNSVRDKNGNGDKSGGIVGHAGSIKLTSNSVTNLNLYAYRDSGGITGYSETLSNISGNIVTTGNLRLDKTQEMATGEAVDNKWNLGAIVGRPNTKTQSLGEGNSFDKVNSSIKEKDDEDFRVIETVVVGYTPIIVEESGSIQAAIDAATAGDTILVAEGTYVESLIIPSGKEGLVLKSVSGADATVINGNIALGADNITIEGFTIGNSGARNGYVGLERTSGSKITNNIINGSKATVSIGNTTGNTVDSVTIEGNTINGGTIGLYPTSGSTITISNNTINSGNGEIIWIHGAGQNSTSLILDIQGNIAIQEEDVITIHFKPVSINGVVDELDMISTIRNDNEPVEVVLGWVKTVGATDADFTTIQDAVNGVNGGDTILVKAGTYTADNTNPITINKKVTLMGDNALINVSTGNEPIQVNADGTVIQGFMITKTDTAHQDIIYINANNVKIMNNIITGQYELGNDQVDRAILGVSGKTGIQIVGNTINNLRQPAYFNGGNTGDVIDNYVTNTRGWVVCGDSKMSFTGNTFGTNAVDIAIIPNKNTINNYGTTPQEIIAISESNNGAYVENQLSKISAKDGELYKTVSLMSGETEEYYYYKIQEAINSAEEGDTILVAPGTYEAEQIKISKKLTLKGVGDQSIIQATTDKSVLTLEADGITIKDLKLVGAEGTEKGAGIKIGSQVPINGLTIENCIIKDFTNGIFADTNKDAKPVVENVHIINSRFINNTLKGIYIEKLSESTIENCYFEGNGHYHNFAGAGIDINAKYTDYSDIVVKGCTFVNNGTGTDQGGGILVKARGTGDDSSYSSSPATLENVTIEDCTFENNPKAIVLGEADKNNTGPTNVVITNATYIDNEEEIVDHRKSDDEEKLEKLDITSFGREELDLIPLDAAIETAIAVKEGIVVSVDGTDVPAGTYWVTQEDMDALDEAIAAAEVAIGTAETQQDIDDAVEELEAAIAAFNNAKQEAIDEEEIEESGQGEEPAEGEKPEEDVEPVEGEEAVEGEEQEE